MFVVAKRGSHLKRIEHKSAPNKKSVFFFTTTDVHVLRLFGFWLDVKKSFAALFFSFVSQHLGPMWNLRVGNSGEPLHRAGVSGYGHHTFLQTALKSQDPDEQIFNIFV